MPVDTYGMAFKALNWNVMAELDLEREDSMNAFQSAVYVFFI